MENITNVDKLRIRDVEQGVESDKILVIDSDNVVRWIDAIEVDLSDYYTISEVDAFVSNLEAELLERYTKDEVDALLDGLELRLDDYYTKTEVDSIITNINNRIDNLTLSDVTSNDNLTSIKIRGSSIFTNNLETDFAQIADVNKAGFGLISMQSEMKIGLVAKDGTTLLDDVDVSWLASGDLAVTIDNTDPNNPELVFSQNGVEVARIPASTLLSGVARSANLSNYILQFKDGTGAVVYSVNLEPLFEDYFTKAEANARFALRTRTISAGNGLTGGGNLTANRTIGLSTDTQEDIAKGVTAHGWGDYRVWGLGAILSSNIIDQKTDLDDYFGYGSNFNRFSSTENNRPFDYGTLISLPFNNTQSTQISVPTQSDIVARSLAFRGSVNNSMHPWRYVWDDFNLPDPATESWSDSRFALRTRSITGTGGLTGGGNLTANRTIDLSSTTKSDIALGKTAHGWGNHSIEDYFKTYEDIPNGYDLDNADYNGVRRITSSVFSSVNNTPSGSSGGSLFVSEVTSSYKSQHLYMLNGRVYHRIRTFDSWEVWKELWNSHSLPDPATETWSNSRFANKTTANTFTQKNTFNQPIVVPMATNSNEAVNLAQLTASNPIALNKIVGSKNYPIPAISASTEFPIELDENTAVAVVPANLLPVVGSVAKVTMFMHTTRSIQGGVYKSLVNSTNLGIGKLGTHSTNNQSVSVYVEVEVILTRTSYTNVSKSSKIRETARANSAAGSVPFFDKTAINTDHSQNANVLDFLTVEIMAQVDAGSYIIHTSPVLIEKIK